MDWSKEEWMDWRMDWLINGLNDDWLDWRLAGLICCCSNEKADIQLCKKQKRPNTRKELWSLPRDLADGLLSCLCCTSCRRSLDVAVSPGYRLYLNSSAQQWTSPAGHGNGPFQKTCLLRAVQWSVADNACLSRWGAARKDGWTSERTCGRHHQLWYFCQDDGTHSASSCWNQGKLEVYIKKKPNYFLVT